MEPGKRKILLKKLNLRELNAACSEGDEKAVLELLQAGNETPAKGRTLKRALSRESEERKIIEEVRLPKGSFSVSRESVEPLPIHTACQRRISSGKIVEVLLTSGSFSVEDQTVSRDTALHVACISKNLEAVGALLKFSEPRAIEECLIHQNKDGNTPFHLAAVCCSSDIIALLLDQLTTDNTHSIITKKNRLGQTCLGISISPEYKDWPTAQLLLTHSHSNPASLYSDFLSLVPDCSLTTDFKLQVLDHKSIDVFVLGNQESGKSTLISTLLQAMQPAGFAKYATMLAATFMQSHTTSETCKISIVPSTVEYQSHRGSSDHRCPVTFHDVNYYHGYSQEAIFKCTSDPLEALYIISVDMTKDIEGSILYWLHFLYRQLNEYTSVAQSPSKMKKLKILAIGTFSDLVPSSRPRLVNITDLLSRGKMNTEFASHFYWYGDHCVNTKKTSSCSAILSTIHDQCCHIPRCCLNSETKSLLAQTYILANLLLKEYPNTSVIAFNDVIGRIQSTESTLCALLPKEDPTRIEMLCQTLKHFSRFKVLMLSTARRKACYACYIIFDYKYLLRAIEQAFENLSYRSHHGIVAKQDIKDVFEYHHQFIIRFLEHLNLCENLRSQDLNIMRKSIRSSRRSRRTSNISQQSTHEVPVINLNPPVLRHKRSKSESDSYADFARMTGGKSDSDIIKSNSGTIEAKASKITSSGGEFLTVSTGTPSNKQRQISSPRSSKRSPKKEDSIYFLPTLISRVQSKELWDDNNDEYGYGFAWSLVPREGDTCFLSQKFITVMLFRLLFSFAPSPTSCKFPLERTCELWDQGIVWCDPHGARICVAVSDHNKITLSMQCLKGSEIACLSIRNEIMSDIKQKLGEFHPGFTLREILLPFEGNRGIFPVFDPLMSYAAFDKEEIRKAIVEDHTVLCTKAKKHKHVDSLLYFEPLCFLGEHLLLELFDTNNSDKQISDDFCMTFAKKLSCKWTFLAQHWETILQKYYIDSLKVSTSAKSSPHDTAMEMLTHLKDIEYKDSSDRVDTYSGLQKSLFEISIFSPESITRILAI